MSRTALGDRLAPRGDLSSGGLHFRSPRGSIPVARAARLLGTAHRLDDETRGHIRVCVCVRTTVLDVTLAVLSDLPRDPHRRTAVADPIAELLVRAGLVKTGEPLLDAEPVVGDVQVVPFAQRLGRGDARVVVLAHLVRREVRVRTRAVPVTADGLRIQRRADAVVLPYPVEKPSRDPQLVADSRSVQRTDLEFPLARHDLGVDPRDLEARPEARVEMRLHD